MRKPFKKRRQIGISRYYQATDIVFSRLVSEGSQRSNDELRISWQLNFCAAQRMVRLGMQLGESPTERQNIESDVVEVLDTISFLIVNNQPEVLYFIEKQLARLFEEKYSPLALDYSRRSADAFRIQFQGLEESLRLEDVLAITHDWETTNLRRVELIEKEISEKLTEAETAELQRLQKLAWTKRNT